MTERIVDELGLEAIAPGGFAEAAFRELVRPWLERGVQRWLELLRLDASRPVLMLGGWPEGRPSQLEGVLVGVWASTVLERFDALFDEPAPGRPATERPNDGTWHFIAVSTREHRRGLGHELVEAGLARLERLTPRVEARTLSPAFGLPELARALPNGSFRQAVRAVVTRVRDGRGRPRLSVQRFHERNGARLERVLFDSRRDDEASARMTLRFRYPLAEGGRRAAAEASEAEVTRARQRIERGEAEPLPGLEDAWLLPSPPAVGGPGGGC